MNHSPHWRRVRVVAGVATFVASPALAQTLTFQQALDLATSSAPSITARADRTAGAQRAAIAADQLPDPKVQLGFDDFRIAQAQTDPPFPNTYVRQTIGIEQDIPNAKKRHARTARAQADIGAAQAGEAVTTRDVRVGAALAWIDLYYAEQKLEVLKLLDANIADLKETINARLVAGSATAAQVFDPAILKAQLDDRRSERIAAVARARAQLIRWTGAVDPDVAGPAPEPDIDATALRAGINSLPSLRADDASIRQADADVRIAQAQKNPDIGVSASFVHRQPRFGSFVSVGVSVSLPIFPKKRQDPLIDARLKAAQSARLERADAERAALAALSSDLADHRMYQEKYDRARDVLVPLAKKRALVAQDSYAAGRIDLGTALSETVALANAQIDLVDREAALERDAVRIMLVNTGDIR